MANNILIGSHISMKSPNFFLGTVEEAHALGESVFMFYTGAPQNSLRIPVENLKVKEALELMKQYQIDTSKVIVHAPYIINLGNSKNDYLYNLSKTILKTEMERTSQMGLKRLVLHPGAHVGEGSSIGIEYLVKALNEILDNDTTGVTILIETMAGKGSELGCNLDEVKTIVDSIHNQKQIAICFDTCHLNDSGIDLTNTDEFIEKIVAMFGQEKIQCIHINDSKNVVGAHKDRHENIGYGTIGFDIINRFVHHPLLIDVPKILETPYYGSLAPYKKEIEMLKNGQYEEGWREKLV